MRETQVVSSTLCLQYDECLSLSDGSPPSLPWGELLFILLQANSGAAPHCSHVPNSAPATGYLAVGTRQPCHHCASVIMPPPTRTRHAVALVILSLPTRPVPAHTSDHYSSVFAWSAVRGQVPSNRSCTPDTMPVSVVHLLPCADSESSQVTTESLLVPGWCPGHHRIGQIR